MSIERANNGNTPKVSQPTTERKAPEGKIQGTINNANSKGVEEAYTNIANKSSGQSNNQENA